MRLETFLFFIFIFQTSIAFSQDQKHTRGLQPKVIQGKNYIFSIGIDKYDSWMHLDNAVNDATSFSATLIENFDFEEIIPPLLNESASRINISNILRFSLSQIYKTITSFAKRYKRGNQQTLRMRCKQNTASHAFYENHERGNNISATVFFIHKIYKKSSVYKEIIKEATTYPPQALF